MAARLDERDEVALLVVGLQVGVATVIEGEVLVGVLRRREHSYSFGRDEGDRAGALGAGAPDLERTVLPRVLLELLDERHELRRVDRAEDGETGSSVRVDVGSSDVHAEDLRQHELVGVRLVRVEDGAIGPDAHAPSLAEEVSTVLRHSRAQLNKSHVLHVVLVI